MFLDHYKIERRAGQFEYLFYSEGPKGRILKVVWYRQLSEYPMQLFNLSFGDWDEKNQKLDDRAISNNDDRLKILTTVAATLLDFTNNYPEALVIAKGATPSRTRLYQM